MSEDFTVRLEQVFQGPMDLLLHLVREQEVEIHEIEINRVIDGYLAYLRDMESIDIELAGDFVLMAATLMAIKSRSLLPREEVNLEEELDPRDELIQRLIEYRRFKEASDDLSGRMGERARMFRHARRAPKPEEPTLDFADLTEWDLLSAFSRLMRETMTGRKIQIASDERPLRFYVEDLVSRIKTGATLSLRSLIEECASEEDARPRMIGTFCALLELMKIGVVRAWQADIHADISLQLREDVDEDVDEIVRASGFDDETLATLQASNPVSAEDAGGSPDGGPAPIEPQAPTNPEGA